METGLYTCIHSGVCKYEKECRKYIGRAKEKISEFNEFLDISVECKYYQGQSSNWIYTNGNGSFDVKPYEITCSNKKEN